MEIDVALLLGPEAFGSGRGAGSSLHAGVIACAIEIWQN